MLQDEVLAVSYRGLHFRGHRHLRPEPSEEDAVLSAEQEKLLLRQNLISELEALFPKPEYTWKTTYKVVCVRSSPYGCLRTERQRDQDGIIEVIDANITPEMVESLDDSLVTFGTLVRVLKEAPLMERGKLIEPTLKILRERRAKFLEQTRIRDLEIRVIQYEHNEKLQAWQTQVGCMIAIQKQPQVLPSSLMRLPYA